jgi:hypothetical protein
VASTDFVGRQSEDRFITANSNFTLTLDRPFNFNHWGKPVFTGVPGRFMVQVNCSSRTNPYTSFGAGDALNTTSPQKYIITTVCYRLISFLSFKYCNATNIRNVSAITRLSQTSLSSLHV